MAGATISKKFRTTSGLCLGAFGVSVIALCFAPDDFTRKLFSNTLCALASGFAAFWCLVAAEKLRATPLARVWMYAGLSFATWCLGTIVWAIYELGADLPPFPSLADILYICCYPLFFASILAAPRAYESRIEKAKLFLDAGSVMLAGLLVLGSLIAAPLIRSGTSGTVTTLLTLAYPVGDLAMLWGLAFVLQRSLLRDRVATFFFIGSFLGMILTNGIFSYRQLTGLYKTGEPTDLLFIGSLLLGGLAGLRKSEIAPDLIQQDLTPRPPKSDPVETGHPSVWQRYVRNIALPVALLALAWSPVIHLSTEVLFLVVGSLLFVAIVFIRQMVALRENQELNDSLRQISAGLQQRTAELQRANEQIRAQFEERQRIETERQEFAVKMEQVQKLESLGVLAGGIAHDFNNLLTVIIGNNSLAATLIEEDHEVQPFLADVQAAAARAAGLTAQMLAYSGKGAFSLTRVDLNALTMENANLLGASISKKARLQLEMSDCLPEIEGDASQLTQVVMNLIINASEAIDPRPGTITIRTGTMMVDQAFLAQAALPDPLPSGSYIFLEVSDDGIGMDRETVARIFEPFFTTKFTGRGLGLAATLGIVRGHKGSIQVHSEPGAGTRFVVVFPPATGLEVLAEPIATSPLTIKEAKTVLLVDDESLVRKVASRLLRQEGFQILEATHGGEAIEAVSKHGRQIDAILLDLLMPVMGGEEAFKEIRRIAPTVPVVLASGFTESAVSARFEDGLPTGFLQKPFTTESLTRALNEAIEKG